MSITSVCTQRAHPSIYNGHKHSTKGTPMCSLSLALFTVQEIIIRIQSCPYEWEHLIYVHAIICLKCGWKPHFSVLPSVASPCSHRHHDGIGTSAKEWDNFGSQLNVPFHFEMNCTVQNKATKAQCMRQTATRNRQGSSTVHQAVLL